MILRQCPRVIHWKIYRQTLWEWSHLFWSLANLQCPCDGVDAHTATSECSSLSPSSPWCCPRKPITDGSSLVMYKDSPSLGNTDTKTEGTKFELQCDICFCSCSSGEQLCQTIGALVCLIVTFYICRPFLSLPRDHLWHIPWDLQLARLRNDAFQEYFSNLWVFNFFHFKSQLAPLHITAKGIAVEGRQWNVFGDILRPSLNGCSDLETEAVGLLILYKAVELKCKMNCLRRKGLDWWKVVMTGEKLQYQNLIIPWALNLMCDTYWYYLLGEAWWVEI